MGGVRRTIFGDASEVMRLPDEILQCVCFLGVPVTGSGTNDIYLGGTAFFVSVPSELPGRTYVYLVTAKHCLTEAKEYSDELYVRLNTRAGGVEHVKVNGDWLTHSDSSVDLAVLPFAPNMAIFEYKALDYTMLGTKEKLEEHEIGIGDELVIAGLFTRRSGQQRNIPIVRCGTLSAMPVERMPDSKSGLSYHGYLAEVRSIGGLSGSPVLAYLGIDRISPRENKINLQQRILILLGAVRAHWEHKEPGPVLSVFKDELDRVNWGIAAITPATELADIILGEPLNTMRKSNDKRLQAEDAPVNDSAFTTRREEPTFTNDESKSPEQAFTKKDFESALKKTSRKVEK